MNMRDAQIIALDDGTRTLQDIGDEFGLTRERVRQILALHGVRPHSELIEQKKRAKEIRVEMLRQKALRQREAQRTQPSEHVQLISNLYNSGLTAGEVGSVMGLAAATIGVAISGRYRKRWPHLFPYKAVALQK